MLKSYLPQRTTAKTVSVLVAANEHKGFGALPIRLEAADVLIVTKQDRLGRNAMDVRATVELGVSVHCLALGGVDLTSPAGKLTMQVIAAVAVFERDLLIEGTQVGLTRAVSQGMQLGRPSSRHSPETGPRPAAKALCGNNCGN